MKALKKTPPLNKPFTFGETLYSRLRFVTGTTLIIPACRNNRVKFQILPPFANGITITGHPKRKTLI